MNVVEDMGAYQVHRQQVGGELYALEYHMFSLSFTADALRQCTGQYGLTSARIIFHEYMAARQQAGDHQFYLSALATYHLFHL